MKLDDFPLLQAPSSGPSGSPLYPEVQEAAVAYQPPPRRIALIREGIPPASLSHFIEHTGLQRSELALALGVSERSLLRYPSQEVLPSSVSERLLRLHDIYQMGVVLGSPPDVTAWLRAKNSALGGDTPLAILDTFAGMQLVEQVLGRLEWGVVS